VLGAANKFHRLYYAATQHVSWTRAGVLSGTRNLAFG
jgi:hypothetical protein